jgi:hypothetical protein
MSKDVKNNPRSKRRMVLVDDQLWGAAKAKCRDMNRKNHTKIKWYQYFNELLAKDVGAEIPTYLRHPTTRVEE